jgi:PAS domain S-box-containing protein
MPKLSTNLLFMTIYIPYYYKLLFTTFITLTIISCQDKTDFALTQDETSWLNQNEGKIEILFGYQEPPNAFHNENGDYVGLLVDYQKELENQLDYNFKFRNFDTWEDLINYSKTAQNFIIIGCERTNKREEYLSFTNAFIKIPYVIISNKNSSVSSMKTLKGKNVCTVSNYAVNDYLAQYYPKITPVNFNSDLECIRAVSTGLCDAMIVNQMSVTHIIENEAISNLKISDKSGYTNRLGVAVSKNDSKLFQIIDKAIDNITPQRHKELYKSWINSRPSSFTKKTWLTILAVLSIFIASIIIMWLWLVSLRKQVSKQTRIIREKEAKYRSLIEESNDAIFLMYDKHFELINRRFEEISGFTTEELEHVSFESLIAPENLDMINNRIKETDKSKLPPKFEFTCILKSGERLPLEVSISYIPYKDGIASQGTIRDLSQNKKYELELIRAKEAAEESDRLKSAFLATMSHELRTPLNAVIGFSSLIQKDLPINEILHFSEIINMSGKHLLGVIEDVFDISLIETGDVKIETEPLSISTVFDEVHEIIKNEQVLQNKEHIKLILDNPLKDSDTILFSDQKRIKQILINLLKNALKFTNEGSVKFGCFLHEEEQHQFIKFFVKDSGIGIHENMQKLIFEVFRQADESQTRIYGGTGLGLTICKKLTKLMGGDIWVESEKNHGANFYFTIPFNDHSEEPIGLSNFEPNINFAS